MLTLILLVDRCWSPPLPSQFGVLHVPLHWPALLDFLLEKFNPCLHTHALQAIKEVGQAPKSMRQDLLKRVKEDLSLLKMVEVKSNTFVPYSLKVSQNVPFYSFLLNVHIQKKMGSLQMHPFLIKFLGVLLKHFCTMTMNNFIYIFQLFLFKNAFMSIKCI